nr:hypothetical protein [Pyxidicoccus caerfyrddinensis]
MKSIYARLSGSAVMDGACVGRPARDTSPSTTVDSPSAGSFASSSRVVMSTVGRASSSIAASRSRGYVGSSGT